MQKVMDEYAGEIRTNYRYNARGLSLARAKIDQLYSLLSRARVQSTDDLLALYEVRDRLVVSGVLIEHLQARKETRWHGFQENGDFPNRDATYNCFINSVMKDGRIQTMKRELVYSEE